MAMACPGMTRTVGVLGGLVAMVAVALASAPLRRTDTPAPGPITQRETLIVTVPGAATGPTVQQVDPLPPPQGSKFGVATLKKTDGKGLMCGAEGELILGSRDRQANSVVGNRTKQGIQRQLARFTGFTRNINSVQFVVSGIAIGRGDHKNRCDNPPPLDFHEADPIVTETGSAFALASVDPTQRNPNNPFRDVMAEARARAIIVAFHEIASDSAKCAVALVSMQTDTGLQVSSVSSPAVAFNSLNHSFTTTPMPTTCIFNKFVEAKGMTLARAEVLVRTGGNATGRAIVTSGKADAGCKDPPVPGGC